MPIPPGSGCEHCSQLNGKRFKVSEMEIGKNAPPMHPNCRCSIAAYEDSQEYDEWIEHLANGGTTESWQKQKVQYARYKEDESVFITLDNRDLKNKDVIKPRNIMKNMRKSEVGKELLEFLEDNSIPVKIWYGVSVRKDLCGFVENGEMNIYADTTKSIEETTLTIIHEATHLKINKPNTKNQELECYKNEYRHRGVALTDEVVESIIKHIDNKYPNLQWE